jgi:hypothetical protein
MKTKFNVILDTSGSIYEPKKMEMLGYVKKVLINLKDVFPEIKKVTVSKEFTNEELMESLSSASISSRGDSQSKLSCEFYDCAQGRHKCSNPLVKLPICNGVCKDYKPKKK